MVWMTPWSGVLEDCKEREGCCQGSRRTDYTTEHRSDIKRTRTTGLAASSSMKSDSQSVMRVSRRALDVSGSCGVAGSRRTSMSVGRAWCPTSCTKQASCQQDSRDGVQDRGATYSLPVSGQALESDNARPLAFPAIARARLDALDELDDRLVGRLLGRCVPLESRVGRRGGRKEVLTERAKVVHVFLGWEEGIRAGESACEEERRGRAGEQRPENTTTTRRSWQMGRRGRPRKCREDWFCRRVVGKGLLVVVSVVRALRFHLSRPAALGQAQPITLTKSYDSLRPYKLALHLQPTPSQNRRRKRMQKETRRCYRQKS